MGGSSASSVDQVAYMDMVARPAAGLAYKQQMIEIMDLAAGHTVLDIGCGPGTDLPRLVEAVGPTGRVLGVDHAPPMLDEARERMAGLPNVELRLADAHEL